MLKRLRPGPFTLMLVESALLGLFFVQSLRFLIGMLYTRTAGASLLTALNAIGVQPLLDSAPSQAQVNSEIAFTIAMLALPLLALILIRWRSVILLPIALMVIGRALVNQPAGLSATQAAALVVGAGLMGSGIAVAALDAGFCVTVVEQTADAAEKGRLRITMPRISSHKPA